ncbi:MAG: serine hydrolase [Symbiobacteriia bacterium]
MSASKVIGLALLNPQTLWEFHWNPDRRFPLGSVAKLLLAAAALSAMDRDLDDQTTHLVRDAVSLHSRRATDQLLDMVGGAEAVNTWLQSRGYIDACVASDPRDLTANSATPQAIAHFLNDLSSGRLLHSQAQGVVLSALAEQADSDGVLQGVPPGTGWAHVTGGFEGVCNDVGILAKPRSALLCCVFVQGDPAGDWNELRETVAQVGRIVWALP